MTRTAIYGAYIAIICLFVATLCCTGCTLCSRPPQKTYTIAYPTRWQNIPLYGTEQSVTGFSSDLVYEIAKQMDLKVQLISADQETFPAILESGAVDGVLASIPVNTVTEQYYEFSNSYFVSGSVVVVLVSSPFTSSNDLKNVEIGFDRSEGSEIIVGAKSTWLLRPYDTAPSALEDLVAGKLDGVILNFINASRLARSLYRMQVKILYPPLVTQNVRLAVRRGKNHELIERFNQGVQKYVKSGEYKELLNYWGIESQLLPENYHKN